MRDSVPSASYSSVCNVLRQWNIPLIPTYRVDIVFIMYCMLDNIVFIMCWMCPLFKGAHPTHCTVSKGCVPNIGHTMSPYGPLHVQ